MKRLLRLAVLLLATLIFAAPQRTMAQDDGDPWGDAAPGTEAATEAPGGMETGGEPAPASDDWSEPGDAGAGADEVAQDAPSSGMFPAGSYTPASTTSSGGGGLAILIILLGTVFSVLMIIAGWRILTKAGQPGWAILIPIYQIIVFCKAAGKPAWWFVLLLIPGVNIVISLLLCLGLASKFGKGAGFGVGLFLLPLVFVPILGFGPAAHEDGPPPAERPASAGGTASSKEITVFGVLTILAGLCFLALVVLQVMEFVHYQADPSVWNPKP